MENGMNYGSKKQIVMKRLVALAKGESDEGNDISLRGKIGEEELERMKSLNFDNVDLTGLDLAKRVTAGEFLSLSEGKTENLTNDRLNAIVNNGFGSFFRYNIQDRTDEVESVVPIIYAGRVSNDQIPLASYSGEPATQVVMGGVDTGMNYDVPKAPNSDLFDSIVASWNEVGQDDPFANAEQTDEIVVDPANGVFYDSQETQEDGIDSLLEGAEDSPFRVIFEREGGGELVPVTGMTPEEFDAYLFSKNDNPAEVNAPFEDDSDSTRLELMVVGSDEEAFKNTKRERFLEGAKDKMSKVYDFVGRNVKKVGGVVKSNGAKVINRFDGFLNNHPKKTLAATTLVAMGLIGTGFYNGGALSRDSGKDDEGVVVVDDGRKVPRTEMIGERKRISINDNEKDAKTRIIYDSNVDGQIGGEDVTYREGRNPDGTFRTLLFVGKAGSHSYGILDIDGTSIMADSVINPDLSKDSVEKVRYLDMNGAEDYDISNIDFNGCSPKERSAGRVFVKASKKNYEVKRKIRNRFINREIAYRKGIEDKLEN